MRQSWPCSRNLQCDSFICMAYSTVLQRQPHNSLAARTSYIYELLKSPSSSNLAFALIFIHKSLASPLHQLLPSHSFTSCVHCNTRRYVGERLVSVCALIGKQFLRALRRYGAGSGMADEERAAIEFGRAEGVLLSAINAALTQNLAANTSLVYVATRHIALRTFISRRYSSRARVL